ncbi:MAG: 2-C-methyl-D-erythritol 2,4-cyclodiphosphate synthase [Planctomycetales bacterium]|nr:2-C-methyl-D-erythritol 2,4-cyclodiphosphate synthase [Planctomycetales bacterium]
MRVGLGHDTHRLIPGGPLRIGGIEIPFEHHLAGHSDADVLLHAITDALLGACCLGDIGQMFPNTDSANKGRDSAEMLHLAWQQANLAGWQLINLDCVVLAERPKLAPYREAIAKRIAEILRVDSTRIGLKGKTGEQVGSVGEGKVIQAMCTCLLSQT